MTPERWQQVKPILDAALRRDPGERVAYLGEACGRDPALREEVERLLAWADEGEALERPPLENLADVESLLAAGPQRSGAAPETKGAAEPALRIGAYRTLRELGRGGAGVVYLAARDDAEYRKRVAIKVLSWGAEFGDIVSRFRNERQIVAGMEHPNVARLLDGGSTEDGRPYFVMEYVEGRPIDRYCDAGRLSIRERLRLFLGVCSAVDFVHRNLVVHRDLKPANILVTPDDVPKLLDFGIAKLLSPELSATPLDVTHPDTRAMTPEYASPEQVRGDPITTASDIYSLGVLLYELLAGRRPYRLRSRQLHELARAICEEEPMPPSAAAALTEDVPGRGGSVRKTTPETVSSARAETPWGLRRRLEGDLDAVVLMALRKEPQRRYGSVGQLAEDVQRVLEGLPIRARTPTLAYRASRFLRRHKTAVAASVAVAVSLMALSTVAVWQRDRARKEAARAAAISAFLKETLRSGDPTARGGRAVTVEEVLARAVGRIQSSFANDAETAAELKHTLGSTYSQLGLHDEAEPLLRSSLDLLARTRGESDSSLILPLDALATVRKEQGDYEEAERLYDRALGLSRAFGRDNALEAKILGHLGSLHARQQRYAAAEQLFERALAIERRVWASDPAKTAESLNNLAAVYAHTGRYLEAEPLLRRSLALTERELGPEHPSVTTVRANLGAVALGLRRYAEAEPLIVQALETEEKVLGSEHPSVAGTRGLLGRLYLDQGRHAEAEAPLRSSLKATEAKRRTGSARASAILGDLGRLDLELHRYAEAESLLHRSLELAEARPGVSDPEMARLLIGLAELSARTGRFEEGEHFCRNAQKAEERIRQWGGDAQLYVADRLKVEALLQAGQGRHGTAEELSRQALAIYEKALGPEHPEARRVRESLSTLSKGRR